MVLVAVGRVPYTDGLGLEAIGVQRDAKGRILTDAHFATNVTGIYAIGDVIAGPMLAHKAEDEGVAVAEILAGKAGHVNYDVIPNVVYTDPEVASRRQDRGGAEGGRHRLQRRQVPVHGERPRQGQPHHRRLREDPRRRDDRPRARASTSSAPDAGNLIAECGIAMEFGGSSEDIARTCHAAPDADRGGQGSGAGGREARHPHVSCRRRGATRARRARAGRSRPSPARA